MAFLPSLFQCSTQTKSLSAPEVCKKVCWNMVKSINHLSERHHSMYTLQNFDINSPARIRSVPCFPPFISVLSTTTTTTMMMTIGLGYVCKCVKESMQFSVSFPFLSVAFISQNIQNECKQNLALVWFSIPFSTCLCFRIWQISWLSCAWEQGAIECKCVDVSVQKVCTYVSMRKYVSFTGRLVCSYWKSHDTMIKDLAHSKSQREKGREALTLQAPFISDDIPSLPMKAKLLVSPDKLLTLSHISPT